MIILDRLRRLGVGMGAVVLCLVVFSPARAETIVVAADEWCPYNCEPGTARPGYAIEILQKIFEPHGHVIEYKVMPWSRALLETRAGRISAAVGALPSEAPDLLYPEEEHGLYRIGFYSRWSGWRYEGRESVKGLLFGVAQGYSYGEELDGLIAAGHLRVAPMPGDRPLAINLWKLESGRLDGVIADQAVFAFVSRMEGLQDRFCFCGSPDDGHPLYVAFAPNRPESETYARLLSEGIRELRRSGDLARLLTKYHLKDWR